MKLSKSLKPIRLRFVHAVVWRGRGRSRSDTSQRQFGKNSFTIPYASIPLIRQDRHRQHADAFLQQLTHILACRLAANGAGFGLPIMHLA